MISVDALRALVVQHGFDAFMSDLMEALKRDYQRWDEFTKMPRPAMHVTGGVLELMPICDNTYYTFKYVNCHPKNPLTGKMTVVATGQLSRIDTGYPLMYSEMTILTAFRTAAMAAVATDLMARRDAGVVAIIGTGAQSEFQIKGLRLIRDIQEVRYFDIDAKAMDKFAENMKILGIKLTRCASAEAAVQGADIITVCTACKEHVDVIKNDWVKAGVHINALGGDCPGKTELELDILPRSKIVVEYLDQAQTEGEIQRLNDRERQAMVYGEIHELVKGTKHGRENESDITLFDSVGIGLEDYAALRLTYELSEKYKLVEEQLFIPELTDPKNLVASLS